MTMEYCKNSFEHLTKMNHVFFESLFTDLEMQKLKLLPLVLYSSKCMSKEDATMGVVRT